MEAVDTVAQKAEMELFENAFQILWLRKYPICIKGNLWNLWKIRSKKHLSIDRGRYKSLYKNIWIDCRKCILAQSFKYCMTHSHHSPTLYNSRKLQTYISEKKIPLETYDFNNKHFFCYHICCFLKLYTDMSEQENVMTTIQLGSICALW